jgi:hypothetical protein
MMIDRLLVGTLAALSLLAVPVAPPASADPLDDLACTAWNADGSCYWSNCSEAKANGECDIPIGSAHYCTKQDKDGDGVACEC